MGWPSREGIVKYYSICVCGSMTRVCVAGSGWAWDSAETHKISFPTLSLVGTTQQ